MSGRRKMKPVKAWALVMPDGSLCYHALSPDMDPFIASTRKRARKAAWGGPRVVRVRIEEIR